MKLIDKDALVAEIEKRKSRYNRERKTEPAYYAGLYEGIDDLKDFLNTLETKEVDDRPECKIFPRPIECYSNCKECPWLATNNKAQKGEKV